MRVHRNHFGRQIESFVADVELPFLAPSGPAPAFPGVFIRAPIVEQLLVRGGSGDSPPSVGEVVAADRGGAGGGGGGGGAGAKAEVEILAVLPGRTARVRGGPVDTSTEVQGGDLNNIVAVRQGNVLGTSFHPELTDDVRIHVWWLDQVINNSLAKR